MENMCSGRRVRAFRKLKGYTQEKLARKIGVSVSVLGEIERETREPALQILEDIAVALNIHVDELIVKTDQEEV
ncbi:MAG: helix-turn-helix domain-containing protein [Bacilli bacterium]